MTCLWGKGIAKILGLKTELHGKTKLDNEAFFIVSNHLGYIDIVAHASLFPMRFTPKSDIMWWPLVGLLVAVSRPIWMKREQRHSAKNVNKLFKETIELGVSLIVYPEGTSSDGSKGLLPFKSSIFEIPCVENLPVLPVILSYPDEKKNEICWFGEMAFAPHAWNLLGMKKINARIEVLPPVKPNGMNRKEFCEKIYSVMNKQFLEIKQNFKISLHNDD